MTRKASTTSMHTTNIPASEGELTLDEALAEAQAGIFDDRLDRFLPLDLYGPPTAGELVAATRKRSKAAGAAPAKGRDGRNGHASDPLARKPR